MRRKTNAERAFGSVPDWRPDNLEMEPAKGAGEERPRRSDGRLNRRQRQGRLVRFRALPQFHNENRVGFVVTDTHLVRQATDLLESGVARGEVRDSSSRLPGTAPNVPTFAKVMLGTLVRRSPARAPVTRSGYGMRSPGRSHWRRRPDGAKMAP